ncbi:MAG: hypothetical protein R3B49_04225 [Phycisphaerales bacterium]
MTSTTATAASVRAIPRHPPGPRSSRRALTNTDAAVPANSPVQGVSTSPSASCPRVCSPPTSDSNTTARAVPNPSRTNP